MNTMMRKIFFFAIILLLIPNNSYAQIELGMLKYPVFITVKKEGSLEKEIKKSGYNRENIKTLRISGEINAKDIQYLNEMTNLKYLDLSDVNIKAGKSYIYRELNEKGEKKKNKNKIKASNSIYKGMFNNLKQILAIKLPKNTKMIEKGAFPSKKYFDIYFTGQPPILKSTESIEMCKTIIVPNSYYNNYISLNPFRIYQNKILKDTAPETYKINLGNNNVEYYLKGAYPYVKEISIVGKLSKKDIESLKKCINLESINLLNATIQDDKLDEWARLISNNVPKSDTLISIETKYVNLCEQISQLESEKEKIVKKHKNAAEQELVYGLLNAVVGLADKDLEKEYNENNVSSSYYMQNKVFNSLLDDELKKKLENLKISKDPEKTKQAIAIIDYKIIELNEESNIINEKMTYLTEKYYKEKSEAYKKVYNGSIIPENLFNGFTKIKNIVLPHNTIIIPEKSLPSKGVKIQMNRNNILISKNIYY